MGFIKKGESKEEAQNRLALTAERRVNATGEVRMHVIMPKEMSDDTDV